MGRGKRSCSQIYIQYPPFTHKKLQRFNAGYKDRDQFDLHTLSFGGIADTFSPHVQFGEKWKKSASQLLLPGRVSNALPSNDVWRA